MCEKYYLNYNVKIEEFKMRIIKEQNFLDLPLQKQKEMFISMLDLNQLYIQKTEIEDKLFGIDEESRHLTKLFYQEN